MPDRITAFKSDLPYRAVAFLTKGNPLATALVYFAISYLGLHLVICCSDGLQAIRNTPRHLLILNNIVLGLLGPLGAAVLCHLYRTIRTSFASLGEGHVIPAAELQSYWRLLRGLEKAYNNRYGTVLAVLVGLGFSVYNYFSKPGTWLGVGGGVGAVYARVFIAVNVYIICVVVYKCAVTAWGIGKILRLRIDVQPMHPDRCGGLRPIGQLSLAINYFVVIVMVYFALVFIFDPLPRQQPFYLVLYLIFYFLGPWLVYACLAPANKRMSERKDQARARLNRTFAAYYERIAGGDNQETFKMEAAGSIPALYDLYRIVDRMPVWPFDLASMTRFAITYALPFILFLADGLTNRDSVIFRVGKLIVDAQTF